MSEVVGAFRYLTGLTSVCLLPATLGFSKMFHPKIMFDVIVDDFPRTRVLFLRITGPGVAHGRAGRKGASPAVWVLLEGD